MAKSILLDYNVPEYMLSGIRDLNPEYLSTRYTDMTTGIPMELTDGERNVELLIDLLRREDTTDEELRKQIDALQQAREKTRKEWPKAK